MYSWRRALGAAVPVERSADPYPDDASAPTAAVRRDSAVVHDAVRMGTRPLTVAEDTGGVHYLVVDRCGAGVSPVGPLPNRAAWVIVAQDAKSQ